MLEGQYYVYLLSFPFLLLLLPLSLLLLPLVFRRFNLGVAAFFAVLHARVLVEGLLGLYSTYDRECRE